VVKGVGARMAYPGDPLARPGRELCAVAATGAIRRERDDLVSRATVCSLPGNSHDTEPHQVSDALATQMGFSRGSIHVVKHFPEQYLVLFPNHHDRQRVLDRAIINNRGRCFSFAPWSEQRHGSVVRWEFHVRLRIEGIPVHA